MCFIYQITHTWKQGWALARTSRYATHHNTWIMIRLYHDTLRYNAIFHTVHWKCQNRAEIQVAVCDLSSLNTSHYIHNSADKLNQILLKNKLHKCSFVSQNFRAWFWQKLLDMIRIMIHGSQCDTDIIISYHAVSIFLAQPYLEI